MIVTLLEIIRENKEYKYSKYKKGQIWEVHYHFDDMWVAVLREGDKVSHGCAICKKDAIVVYEEKIKKR